jgi:hypothetical protein
VELAADAGGVRVGTGHDKPTPSGPSFPAAALRWPPAVGEHAEGHGVSGTIAAVPERQPLADEGIWRVALEGEVFGRLVRRRDAQGRRGGAAWHLLQLDELTEAQLETYDAAMLGPPP